MKDVFQIVSKETNKVLLLDWLDRSKKAKDFELAKAINRRLIEIESS